MRVLWALQPPHNHNPIPLLFRIRLYPNPDELSEFGVKGNIKVTDFQDEADWEGPSPELLRDLCDDKGNLHLLFDLLEPAQDNRASHALRDWSLPDDMADFLRGLLDDDEDESWKE